MNYTIVKTEEGYANFLVYIDRPATGRPDLWVNTQYETINADNTELVPEDRNSLFIACRNLDVTPSAGAQAGISTPEETAIHAAAAGNADIADQDRRNAGKPGYCPKCHTFCYGDCGL